MALAPSRLLVGVPSRRFISASTARWSAVWPTTAGAISPLTFATALQHTLAEIAFLVAVAQFERFAFAR